LSEGTFLPISGMTIPAQREVAAHIDEKEEDLGTG